MDEPFSGIDPIAVADVQKIIRHLKQRGIGVLITDHQVRETLNIVDRGYIIHEGRVIAEGPRDYLINDAKAREFYLTCAGIVGDPGVKKMFEFLAREEGKHFDLLEREHDRFIAGEN